VGLDSDSVLYLLGSEEAFNFLVDRHPPPRLDSAGVLNYARLALELTGRVSVYARLLTSWDDLPASARLVVTWSEHRPSLILSQAAAQYWQLWLFTVAPCFQGKFVQLHQVELAHGRIVHVTDTLVQGCSSM